MKISPSVFEAFLRCPTKSWLRFTGEPTSGNEYAEWVQTENESYRAEAAGQIQANTPADETASPPRSSPVERDEEAHFILTVL
jgi:CRISPR/Cas system-associated exonuclease Cas4 (RecB family)